jgi:hypothetical protein
MIRRGFLDAERDRPEIWGIMTIGIGPVGQAISQLPNLVNADGEGDLAADGGKLFRSDVGWRDL